LVPRVIAFHPACFLVGRKFPAAELLKQNYRGGVAGSIAGTAEAPGFTAVPGEFINISNNVNILFYTIYCITRGLVRSPARR